MRAGLGRQSCVWCLIATPDAEGGPAQGSWAWQKDPSRLLFSVLSPKRQARTLSSLYATAPLVAS